LPGIIDMDAGTICSQGMKNEHAITMTAVRLFGEWPQKGACSEGMRPFAQE